MPEDINSAKIDSQEALKNFEEHFSKITGIKDISKGNLPKPSTDHPLSPQDFKEHIINPTINFLDSAGKILTKEQEQTEDEKKKEKLNAAGKQLRQVKGLFSTISSIVEEYMPPIFKIVKEAISLIFSMGKLKDIGKNLIDGFTSIFTKSGKDREDGFSKVKNALGEAGEIAKQGIEIGKETLALGERIGSNKLADKIRDSHPPILKSDHLTPPSSPPSAVARSNSRSH